MFGFNIPTWAAVVAGGVIVTTVGGFIYSYDSRGREIARLNEELRVSQGAHKACIAQAKLANDSLAVLSQRLETRDADLEQLCKVYVGAASSRAADANDCIDPTIGGVLEGLKKIDEGKKKK
jgi:hypothetical protein